MGRTTEPMVEMATVEELERFFADVGTGRREGVFDGVPFEVEFASEGSGEDGGHAVMNVFRTGSYVRLRLPRRAAANLHVTDVRPAPGGGEPPGGPLKIEATDPDAAREYLAGPLREALEELARTHRVVMDDEQLKFGPLAKSPAESAKAVASVILALPRADEEEAGPDFDEALESDKGEVEVVAVLEPVDAEILRGALGAQGIPCRLAGGMAGGLFGGTGIAQVQVIVPASFAEAAAKAVEEFERNIGSDDAEGEEG